MNITSFLHVFHHLLCNVEHMFESKRKFVGPTEFVINVIGNGMESRFLRAVMSTTYVCEVHVKKRCCDQGGRSGQVIIFARKFPKTHKVQTV